MELHAQIACAMPRELARKGAPWQQRAVYSEAILYCRENLTDGVISRGELPFWMPDMSARTRAVHLDGLVNIGALLTHPDGWAFPEHVWRKWNPTKDEVDVIREAKREAGVLGNHERWHTGPDGKPSHKCPLCIANASQNGSHPDRSTIAPCDRTAKRVGIQPEPEPEPEPEPSSLTSPSNIQEVLNAAAGMVLKHREQNGWGPARNGARTKVLTELAEYTPTVTRWLNHGTDPYRIEQALLARIIDGPTAKAPPGERWTEEPPR